MIDMDDTRLKHALLGERSSVSLQLLVIGFLLMVGLIVLQFGVSGSTWFPSGISLYLFWLGIVLLSAIVAYANRGFLVSIAVAMMVDFSREPVGGLFGPVSPLELVGFALMSALIFGLPLGILGYLIGIGARYVEEVEGSKQPSVKEDF